MAATKETPNAWRWALRLARPLQLALDLSVLTTAFVAAYLLRFDFAVPAVEWRHLMVQLPMVVLIQLVAMLLAGTYSFIWRYVGLAELQSFVRAAIYSALPILFLRFGLGGDFQPWRVPLSIIVLDSLLAFGGLLGMRVLRRLVHERRGSGAEGRLRRPNLRVLLVGAGDAANAIAREIGSRKDTGLELVGILDDDPSKVGSLLQGARVLGTSSDLRAVVHAEDVEQVILAMPEASRDQVRGIVATCEEIPVQVRTIPALHEILDGSVSISRLRKVRIEDLLGREEVVLDEQELSRFLTGKRVLVTGAGGSIGAEMARQVARFNPERLILAERAEFALFDVDRAIEREFPDVERVALVADIGDESRLRTVLSNERPAVVFHAAAHKHVPMMESNAAEAIKNNVLATRLLGRLAGEFEVESFVLISTDKAVRPSSIMGASKRLAELVVQDLQLQCPSTRFLAVRFGNVLGSRGSVIPIFREQIARGGPVTVTHPEMTRYFMTLSEAAQLVLQAGAIGRSGEILILDMGQPVRVLDLAKDMIRLSGLKPLEDIEIEMTGPRPGEKLFEELQLAGEEHERTRHPKIFVGRIQAPEMDLGNMLAELEQLVSLGLDSEIRLTLGRLLGSSTRPSSRDEDLGPKEAKVPTERSSDEHKRPLS